jgi:hypothetical protein
VRSPHVRRREQRSSQARTKAEPARSAAAARSNVGEVRWRVESRAGRAIGSSASAPRKLRVTKTASSALLHAAANHGPVQMRGMCGVILRRRHIYIAAACFCKLLRGGVVGCLCLCSRMAGPEAIGKASRLAPIPRGWCETWGCGKRGLSLPSSHSASPHHTDCLSPSSSSMP